MNATQTARLFYSLSLYDGQGWPGSAGAAVGVDRLTCLVSFFFPFALRCC
jgi:hypothetical protein